MPGSAGDGRRRPLSFGVHQGVEYLVAILLALTAIRLPPDTATPPLLAALAVVLLAVVTDGPLGGFRLLGRRAHRAFDVLLVTALAASPLLLGTDDVVVVVLAEVLAVIFGVLVVRTSYTDAVKRRRPATPPSSVTTEVARTAGRLVGRAGREGPRAMGRFVGRHTKR